MSNTQEHKGFWWQGYDIDTVAQHDYPSSRIKAARRRLANGRSQSLGERVRALTAEARGAEDAVRAVARFVQGALLHCPLMQPAESGRGYEWGRRTGLLPARWADRPRMIEWFGQRLVMDAALLLELGDGRCGQCVAVLCDALREAGFLARPWQLPHHVVTEVVVDGSARVIDADAFKNGIFLECDRGGLVTRRELEQNPYLVDRFKPTGWMFRRDSVYAKNSRTGKFYTGYVDFHSPEVDGQMSERFGAQRRLLPPGIPQWDGELERCLPAGRVATLSFVSVFPERAVGYRVRCGMRGRGYAYDRIMPEALQCETSSEVFERYLTIPELEIRLTEPGRYYVTAAAVPRYVDEFPDTYLWWSDELVIDVII